MELSLDDILEVKLRRLLPRECFLKLPNSLSKLTSDELQQAWIGKTDGHPLQYIDLLGVYGEDIQSCLEGQDLKKEMLGNLLIATPNRSILDDFERTIAGMIVGVTFNKSIERNEST